MEKVNIADKLARIDGYWRPKIVAGLNGQEVKLVKCKGEFIWHHHESEDEPFLVVDGLLRIEFRERVVELLLFEPAATRNTGNVDDSELTAPTDERI